MRRIVPLLLVLFCSFVGFADPPTNGEKNAQSSSWTGTYIIYSDGYRNCPPPMAVGIELTPDGSTYKGGWAMMIADDETGSSGTLIGNITGKVSNGVLTLTMTNCRTEKGEYGCIFGSNDECYPLIPSGTVVATIKRSGSTYTIQPQGKMKCYLNGLGGKLTITKIK